MATDQPRKLKCSPVAMTTPDSEPYQDADAKIANLKIRARSRYGAKAAPCIVTFPLLVVLTHEIVKV
jgi:hypothetical protein